MNIRVLLLTVSPLLIWIAECFRKERSEREDLPAGIDIYSRRIRLAFFILISALFLEVSSATDAKEAACLFADLDTAKAQKDLEEIEAERKSKGASKETAVIENADGKGNSLSFQFNRWTGKSTKTGAARKTVLYFCGGPKPCRPRRPPGFPPDVDIVTFDYLGLGSNWRHNKFDQMRHEMQARAAEAVVKKIPGDYVIAGDSFGTSIGTVVASNLSKKKDSRLKGVLLQGVLAGERDDTDIFAAENLMKNILTPEEVARLKTDYSKLYDSEIGGLSKVHKKHREVTYRFANFNAYLKDRLAIRGGNCFAKSLREQGLHALYQEYMKDEVTGLTTETNSLRVWGANSACGREWEKHTEVTSAWGVTSYKEREFDPCLCRHKAKPYKPREYQIENVPIIYLNGKSDGRTPISQAQTHFDGQKSENKVLFALEGGGHVVFDKCVSLATESLFSKTSNGLEALRGRIENQWCGKRRDKAAAESCITDPAGGAGGRPGID